jgi:hypothetical protein
MLRTILFIFLILILISAVGALPFWGWRDIGYGPFGGLLGLALILGLIVYLMDRTPPTI